MTENEKRFVKAVVDSDANIFKARKYIKENFNIDSEIDENNNLKLICLNANESINLIAAKKYIEEDEYIGNFINVCF